MSEAGGERGVCLVIGAGDGLGASIARAFAREGLRVCVTRRPRNTEAIDTLAEAIRAEGGEAYAFGLDARVEDDVAALIERIEREIGPIEAPSPSPAPMTRQTPCPCPASLTGVSPGNSGYRRRAGTRTEPAETGP